MTIKQAYKKIREFDFSGDLCPICKEQFKGFICKHSTTQARERLNENLIRAIVRDEIIKAGKT